MVTKPPCDPIPFWGNTIPEIAKQLLFQLGELKDGAGAVTLVESALQYAQALAQDAPENE